MASHTGAVAASTRPPRAIKKACNFCKRRHLKCDGLEPSCSHCEHRNIQCIYTNQSPSSDSHEKLHSSTAANDLVAWERPSKLAKLSAAAPSTDEPAYNLEQSPVNFTSQHENSLITKTQPIDHEWPGADGYDTNGYLIRSTLYTPTYDAAPAAEFRTLRAVLSQASPTAPTAPTTTQTSFPRSRSRDFSTLAPSWPAFQPDFVAPIRLPPQPPSRLTSDALVAFSQNIKPIFSGNYVMTDAEDLQAFTQMQNVKFGSFDTRTLIKIFLESTMVAHGCRHSGNSPLGNIYSSKSYSVLVYLIRSRQRNDAEFTSQIQNVVSGMELLAYYCVGSDDLIHGRQVLAEAYRLCMLHKTKVAPATAHRIMGLQVSCSVRDSDAMFYLEKANKIELDQQHPSVTSGFVILAMSLVGRHFGHGDLQHIVPASEPLTDEDKRFLDETMKIVERGDEAVLRLERSQPRNLQLTQLLTVYRGVLSAARAILYWKLGQPSQAVAEAVKVINLGRASPVAKLAYLLSYASSLQILRYMGYNDIFQRGLENLECDAPMYELVQRICEELRSPMRLNDEENATDVKAPKSHEFATDSSYSVYNSYHHHHTSQAFYSAAQPPAYPTPLSSSTISNPPSASPIIETGSLPPNQSYGFDFVPHPTYGGSSGSVAPVPAAAETPNFVYDPRQYWDNNV